MEPTGKWGEMGWKSRVALSVDTQPVFERYSDGDAAEILSCLVS